MTHQYDSSVSNIINMLVTSCKKGANLICRLPNPLAFIDRVATLVAVGGVLVLTTPWTWLEDYTPRDKCKRRLDSV